MNRHYQDILKKDIQNYGGDGQWVDDLAIEDAEDKLDGRFAALCYELNTTHKETIILDKETLKRR
jgi:chitinase